MKVQMMLAMTMSGMLAFGTPVRFEDPQARRPVVACGIEVRGEADGSAVTPWKTTAMPDGWTTLTSGAETASVLVLNGAAVEGGRLTADATWTGAKVHVVRHDVIIPSGITLTLEGGVIVKFLPNTRIWIEQGGKLLAEGVQFADFRDDSVGGDTNLDGDESLPDGTDWWFDVPGSDGIAEWRRPSNACESLGENGLVQVEFAGEGVEVPMVRLWTGGVEFGKGLPVPPYRDGFVFAGWQGADGSVLTAESEVPDVDSSYEAVWDEVPTYGPWGEAEAVKNPDKLGPTMLTDMTLELNGAAGAAGDVVAAFRGDTGALCGLGKVMDDSGTLSMVCYAPTGMKLHFKVWVAASGVEVPVVLDCDAKSDLAAPTSGAFLAGHAIVVSGEKDLTISLRSADWHTVSFNVLPDDPSPAAVFADVAGKVAAVTQGIEFWMPGKTSSLKAIEIGKGYWVNTKVDNVEWTVSGKTDPTVEIALEEGWNLVGYTPETEGAIQAVLKTALAAKAVDYVTYGVEFYPGGTLKKMEPGKAYWVHTKKAYTLVYDEAKEAFKSSSFCGDRNDAALLGATLPTYGPWGENEAVKNPDKLGPTFLIDVAVEIDDEPAACGDVVAVFRGDTGALCGLGKVLDDSGTLTLVCYAPKGVVLSFKVWLLESGVEEPVVVKCDNACNLAAPDVGAFYGGYTIWGSTANEYMVMFDANGGSGAMEGQPFVYDMEQALTACAFTRAGYTFAGWATSAGGEVKYADGATVKNLATSGTVTLYAKWTPNEYTVDFNPGQGGTGTMPDQSMTYDEEEALYANLFARTGYTFLGWTDDEGELEEVLFYDGVVVSNLTDEVDGEYDLYAVWAANEYTVRFNANGGIGTMADQAFLYDEEQALRANGFARAGYTFAGWNVSAPRSEDAAGTVEDGAVVSNLTAEADGVVTLYAKWTPNEYTVDFNPGQGGTGTMPDQSMTYDEEEALYANLFARTGYTFLGWTDDEGELEEVLFCDGVVVSNLTDEVDGEFDLYAVWAANEYTVRFNANGGSGTMADQAFAYDAAQNLTMNGFSRAGCEFLGWAMSSAGEVVYADGASVKNLTATADGVVNLYAVWDVTGLVDPSEAHIDTAQGEVAPFADAAAVYDGYLYDGETVVGSVQVKVAKGKVDKKSGEFSAKVTATVQLAGEAKKLSFKGGNADPSGNVSEMTDKNNHKLAVTVGVKGLGGTFDGKYKIDGARNVFSGKSAADKDAAGEAVRLYQGVYNVAFDGGTLSVSVDKKGKAKIAGTVEGNKVSATSQLVVGDSAAVVPVVIVKKAEVSFCLWVMADGTVEVRGVDSVTSGEDAASPLAGKAGAIADGAKFGMDEAAVGKVKGWLTGLYADYLPRGLAVAQEGKRWIVADGAKAGKLVLDKTTGSLNREKSKFTDNMAGLKLSYKEKDGTFKGSFKAYNLENGKIKSYSASVTGVMIGTKGYGTATIKKPACTFPITIE